jgi:transposase
MSGEGIAKSIYKKWSEEFFEACTKRLSGDTARVAPKGEVKSLCRETHELEEVLAEQALEGRSPTPSRVWDRIF